MKSFVSFILLIACAALAVIGQSSGTVLATASGLTFTTSDLSPDARKLYDQRDQLIARQRTAFYENWISSLLIETEAKARGTTAERIRQEAVAKIAAPTEAQIKAVFDANRDKLGGATLDQVRAEIVDYLKHEAEDKQIAALESSLREKHKYVRGKDINSADLKDGDVVATIGTRALTAADFADKNKLRLHNYRAGLYEQIRADLEAEIFDKLIVVESKKRNIDASSFIAAEITNKMKDYTDYERAYLEDSLQSRLFDQYNVKFALGAPEPIVLDISADDDPSIGSPTAKVTVVAFVDFQCSACAAFSPILRQVLNEFGSDVRLVVRDFPLTATHHDAMSAALAGFAAHRQGKFFELVDLMYRNQSALDVDSLKSYARQIGLDLARFNADMNSPAAIAEVAKDIADANNYGVLGTPTIFVNGVQINRLSPDRVRAAIKQALK